MGRVPMTISDLMGADFLPCLGAPDDTADREADAGVEAIAEEVYQEDVAPHDDAGMQPRFVLSQAGGYAERCNHGDCEQEMWTCCVVCDSYGISSPLCHLHFEVSACHQHRSRHLSYLHCPCKACAAASATHNPSKHAATRLMQSALWVPGMLHILHTVSEELVASMARGDHVVQQVATLAHFFKMQHLRDRFCHTCVDGVHAGQRNLFNSFPSYIDWRWQSLLDCCRHIAALQPALVLFWSTSKMMGKQDVAKAHEEETAGADSRHCSEETDTVRIKKVGEVIADEAFWGYLHMLLLLSETVAELRSWVQSCPCHGASPEVLKCCVQSSGRAHSGCPMLGRRAVEMASGKWRDVLRDAKQTRSFELRVSLVATSHQGKEADDAAILFLPKITQACAAYKNRHPICTLPLLEST